MPEHPPHPGRQQLRREKYGQDEQHVLPRGRPEEAPSLSVFVHREHTASWVRYSFVMLTSFNTFFENQNTSHATMRKSSAAPNASSLELPAREFAGLGYREATCCLRAAGETPS